MELNETSVRIRDCSIDFIPIYVKRESEEQGRGFGDVKVTDSAQSYCAIGIEGNKEYDINRNSVEPNNESPKITGIPNGSVYLQNLDYESVNIEIHKQAGQITDVFFDQNEQMQAGSYSISTVSVPSEMVGLSLSIKREDGLDQDSVYSTEWFSSADNQSDLQFRVSRRAKENVAVPANVKATIAPLKQEERTLDTNTYIEGEGIKSERPKRQLRIKPNSLENYKEKLQRKAECMREKRRKLHEQESEEQRQERLAKDAAKRREMRMYYETPEQRRKRLDAEAARKREYRMYNETPEDRRKRLDREAERRRIKRVSLYASESSEQRRERLNRESAKRREARLNQYAKETSEERKERLQRDALRVREMRFTRSAIETEEERKERLIKDALRKREVRLHKGHSVNNNFAELQTVHDYEELGSVEIKESPDNQLGSHYLSNWMIWFQNSLTQPLHIGEQEIKSHTENNR